MRGPLAVAAVLTAALGSPAHAERLWPTGGASLVDVEWLPPERLAFRPTGAWESYRVTVSGPAGLWIERMGDSHTAALALCACERPAAGVYVYEVVPIPRASTRPTVRPPGAWGSFALAANGALIAPGRSFDPSSPRDVVFNEDIVIQKETPALVLDTAGVGFDWKLATRSIDFTVEDATTGTIPFVVSPTAPDYSLHIGSNGTVGIGRLAGAYALMVGDGYNSPSSLALGARWKLEPIPQDLRITNLVTGLDAMVIQSSTGNLGLGNLSPSASIHVQRSDGSARLLLDELSTTVIGRNLLRLRNNGPATFRFENAASGAIWGFGAISAADKFFISKAGAAGLNLTLDGSGNLAIQGTLSQGSDRNAKRDIEAVDARDILQRIAALPISTWSYRADGTNARHMGPMAQDFKGAFGLGANERQIAPLDVASVALAAVQALQHELEDRDARLRALEQALQAIQASVAEKATRPCDPSSTARER